MHRGLIGGGGGQREFLAARGPYGLNDEQGWGGGGEGGEGGGGGQHIRTALPTISISLSKTVSENRILGD